MAGYPHIETKAHANMEYIRVLNPFDPIMWGFDLRWFPPTEKEPEDKPEFTIDDFSPKRAPQFEGFIEEGQSLHPLYKAFEKIAVHMISYELVGKDEELWKFLVSMYIGHHLEMAMARFKNQADEISLAPEKDKEKKIEYQVDYPKYETQLFQQTKHGFAFWQIYKNFAKFRFFGVYTNRGFEK